MKKIYCEVLNKDRGQFKIKFWTKEDRSNCITTTSPTTFTAHIREAIEKETGLKKFELVFINKFSSN